MKMIVKEWMRSRGKRINSSDKEGMKASKNLSDEYKQKKSWKKENQNKKKELKRQRKYEWQQAKRNTRK